jgi:hypothetical protein
MLLASYSAQDSPRDKDLPGQVSIETRLRTLCYLDEYSMHPME